MANETTKPVQNQQPGLAVDKWGGPVIDPTKNVLDLVQAESKFQNALREASEKFVLSEAAHVKEIGWIRAEHQKEIRLVDIQNQTSARTQAETAVKTLAEVQAQTAEALRKQVADVAAAQETKLSAITLDITKRLSALELSTSASMGKQMVSDPALERLAIQVEQLAKNGQTTAGRDKGIGIAWTVLIAILGLIFGSGMGAMVIKALTK